MLNLNFSYNREKDALNWVNTAKDINPSFNFSYEASIAPISEKLIKEIIRLDKKEAVEEVLKHFSSNTGNKRQELKEEFIEYYIDALNKHWQKHGEELTKKIEKIFGKFKIKTCSIFITTLYICDYNYEEKYFYLSLYHSLAKNFTIIAHELSHFLFYDHFQDYLKKIGASEDKFQDLKESSTVLLNTEEFENSLLIEDSGYKPHQKLRELILSSWQKQKNLKKVIDDVVNNII
ncbi:MAG: hypothetical protein UV70_C0027G0001 [Parcubacteria group bacterium GW2011_GWA2_43_13]|nr:MAG: hypothetical protein UV70_C0027G0001 [Parcubacteria group bacterium GW2011_GWA2_43_13]